ncbi:HI1506-related protein [Asaia bogorensis]|uniref:HI1506-related protein n=1 Tax=Asaia bogorensis TaxID=91915 RepID=UPI000EFD7AE7|nr:HI1506-related protein [Asaia bogorensis]
MAKTPTRVQSDAHDKTPDQEAPIQGANAPGAETPVPMHQEAESHPPADEGGARIIGGAGAAGGFHDSLRDTQTHEFGGDGHTLTIGHGHPHGERKVVGRILLPEGRSRPLFAGDLVITCQEPGFRRAGVAHPAFAIHDEGRFSPNQIDLLRNESKLTVVEIG